MTLGDQEERERSGQMMGKCERVKLTDSACVHCVCVSTLRYGPDFLSPFHNVMSEQGGLTHDGKTIPGWNAKYVARTFHSLSRLFLAHLHSLYEVRRPE